MGDIGRSPDPLTGDFSLVAFRLVVDLGEVGLSDPFDIDAVSPRRPHDDTDST